MMMEQNLLGLVGPLTQWVKSKPILPPKGHFWLSRLGGMLFAWRPGVLLNTPHCAGYPPRTTTKTDQAPDNHRC